jgi:hypothetical protein
MFFNLLQRYFSVLGLMAGKGRKTSKRSLDTSEQKPVPETDDEEVFVLEPADDEPLANAVPAHSRSADLPVSSLEPVLNVSPVSDRKSEPKKIRLSATAITGSSGISRHSPETQVSSTEKLEIAVGSSPLVKQGDLEHQLPDCLLNLTPG